MKGQPAYPSLPELAFAYQRLLLPKAILEKELPEYLRWAEWVRFDPRLGEIWLAQFGKSWKKLSVTFFHEKLQEMTWPSVVGVLLDQFRTYEISSKPDRTFFSLWQKTVLFDVEPVSYQSFFISLSPFASSHLKKNSLSPLKSFSRWGYYGQEVFKNKSRVFSGLSTEIRPHGRREVLRDLLTKRSRIRVDDYLEALDFQIHRRTAELDLKACASLRAAGNTKGRYYLRRRKILSKK